MLLVENCKDSKTPFLIHDLCKKRSFTSLEIPNVHVTVH